MTLRKLFILLVIFCCTAINVKAQDWFYGEVGLTGGGGFVLGDTNDFLFKYTQPVGGAFLKYKFNGHFEARFQLDGGVLGYNRNKDNSELEKMGYTGLQALGEFNFFNYGVKDWEANYSWFSPALVAGVGCMVFNFSDKPKFAMTIPLGVGLKFKLSSRVNLGAYWMVSKVFSDEVDNESNPNGQLGKFWNNQDWYSTAQVYLSVNFYKVCAPCQKGKNNTKRKYIWIH